jgi:hypothetical protein
MGNRPSAHHKSALVYANFERANISSWMDVTPLEIPSAPHSY